MAQRRVGIVLLRLFVGLAFVAYGLAKLPLPGWTPQFVYDRDWSFDARTTHPTAALTLIWRFFGYQPLYGWFIAAAEIVAGLLTLWPRTATLGAMCVLPIALKATVLDWTWGLPRPATLIVTALTAAAAALLWFDRAKFAGLFRDGAAAR